MPLGFWKPSVTDWSCYNPLEKAGFTWIDAKAKDLPKSFVNFKWQKASDLNPDDTVRILCLSRHN